MRSTTRGRPEGKPAVLAPQHLPGLLALWSRRWGAQFPLDRALWQQNTKGDPLHFRPERCWVIEEDHVLSGCLALKVPANPPAWPGQDPRQGWISFLVVEPGREAQIVEPLLERAFAALGAAGCAKVAYGGDPSHFFPGAPEDDATLCRALEHAGFRPGQVAYDLIGDLRAFRLPESAARRLHDAQVAFGPCDAGDTQAVLQFVDTHFPGRWAYETRRRLEVEPTPGDILILKRGREVIGFCHVHHRGSRRIGPSIYWRQAIGDRYGGLGPMGVAPTFRGRGLGFALLAMAVGHLRRLGAERAVIDWTTLVDFYGRLAFQVWRSYRTYQLDL